MFRRSLLLAAVLLMAAPILPAAESRPALPPEAIQSVTASLVAQHGQAHSARVERGVRQVAERWWPEDGDAGAFAEFCESFFITDPADLSRAFTRIQHVLEQVDGHLHEVRRELTTPLDLDTGPVGPVDRLFAGWDPSAHLTDDLFRSKVAFLALLNFPVHTLADRLEAGPGWDREAWARSRMMDRFSYRVPAPVVQEITRAFTEADQYIADYNIRMDRLRATDGRQLFPDGLRLITHWGLRDELASHYGAPGGLEKQRTIHSVMERIIRQEIPRAVIDNPDLLWEPVRNSVQPAAGVEAAAADLAGDREPDTRYAKLLDVFHAVRAVDPYSPTAPTFIARRFEQDRQMPEAEVEALLVSILASDEVKQLAGLIEKRLGRKLEPFDIWYSGFKPRGRYSEAELDAAVRPKYPTVEHFQNDLPRILRDLGFSAERAAWLSERIVVDPSRGAGHAMGAVRREDRAHLRTRVGAGGMDYKGYNIAIHELGHNVEQVFSLNGIDHWWLNGVPNNAFTEAFAFVFQARDLELLGMPSGGEEARHQEALYTLWATYEIGGVSLVDMRVWRWMYEHPDATPAQLREAVVEIARDVWNAYFAPVFGVRDQVTLAVYSHMIVYGLYLPDYAVGHMIAFQVADALQKGDFGQEFERMARQGRLTPDAWMRGAVGGPISADALKAAARAALAAAR
jgi:hypothetical protein